MSENQRGNARKLSDKRAKSERQTARKKSERRTHVADDIGQDQEGEHVVQRSELPIAVQKPREDQRKLTRNAHDNARKRPKNDGPNAHKLHRLITESFIPVDHGRQLQATGEAIRGGFGADKGVLWGLLGVNMTSGTTNRLFSHRQRAE